MRRPGSFAVMRPGELEGVHLGHDDIGDEQVDVRIDTASSIA